ncbi:MAG TPA: Lrp/AsnC family transcriptional regulator [Jatrophihabitans sp.]|nr:Lrp/AsnC family transcriptional regulator [Jatrophihabitans sp.]
MATEPSIPATSAGQMSLLDSTDRKIVEALRHDGRQSMRSLAQRLHISRAGVYARVERLERDGVITGYSATIDPEKYGRPLSAYVNLKVAQRSWQELGDRVLAIDDVDHAALVSGDYDIVLLVRTRDVGTLRDLVLTRLQEMPEVLSTQTVLIFDELHP